LDQGLARVARVGEDYEVAARPPVRGLVHQHVVPHQERRGHGRRRDPDALEPVTHRERQRDSERDHPEQDDDPEHAAGARRLEHAGAHALTIVDGWRRLHHVPRSEPRPLTTSALEASRDRLLKTAANDGIVLAHATATRAVAAWTLAPAPQDPARHVETAHAQARRHLVRLTRHDPAREVLAVMTDELFFRLTDARPAPLTAPAGVTRFVYTPRKALRRVLDHALDHLNQIDQWLAWQRHGVIPTPTDGWVPSTVTLPDDRLPPPLLPAAGLSAQHPPSLPLACSARGPGLGGVRVDSTCPLSTCGCLLH